VAAILPSILLAITLASCHQTGRPDKRQANIQMERQLADQMKPGISVLIPTWNGAGLLRQYLPSLLVALERYDGPWECLVVDDGSTDETLAMLASEFAWVTVIPLPKNGGVSRAFNAGLRAAKYPLVLSMNNDVQVTPDFLAPLLAVFQREKDVFGAGSLQRSKNFSGEPVLEGYSETEWRNGVIQVVNKTANALPTGRFDPGYLSLACALVDREKLVALGGMNEIFSPFYWEDVELCIRARLAGWSLHFCPESVVDHCHCTTTRKRPLMFRLIPLRNYYLFHWLMLDEADLKADFRNSTGRKIIREIFQGKPGWLVGLLLAAPKLLAVWKSRQRYQTWRHKRLRDIMTVNLNS
jgi:GT2 family glycosyltransferase